MKVFDFNLNRTTQRRQRLQIDRIPQSLARDGGFDARLCNVLADAPLLPIGVAGTKPLLAKVLLLIGGNLVVRHQDGDSASSILLVEPHDRVSGCAGAREEVDDGRVRLRFENEPQGVLDRRKGLREGDCSST